MQTCGACAVVGVVAIDRKFRRGRAWLDFEGTWLDTWARPLKLGRWRWPYLRFVKVCAWQRALCPVFCVTRGGARSLAGNWERMRRAIGSSGIVVGVSGISLSGGFGMTTLGGGAGGLS